VRECWVDITWKQIDVNEKTLFSASSLKQGKIGNCYFISVLLTLSDFHIRSLFSLVSSNVTLCEIEKNKVTVDFYRQGMKTPVTIDTCLPYLNEESAFLQGSLWA
jgi:hypothetical protein